VGLVAVVALLMVVLLGTASARTHAGSRTSTKTGGRAPAVAAAVAGPQVLRVGSYHGVPGQFKTIQAAVDAAKPNDWVLIAPGDYKTNSSRTPAGANGDFPAGVLIPTPDLTVRGMNRNTVIVDGTKAGPPCTDNPADQNFGPATKQGPAGLNGIEVWKADDVAVENLTSCNFLGGSGGDGGTGNEVWWNGGADSGTIGGWGYLGEYLNATSSFYNTSGASQVQDEVSAAEYGIFSSNWSGGTWNQTYASNMNDSGYYIGACQQQCDQVIDHAWAEYSALGYSGSNSGGSLVVKHSQFDNNEDGFDTNSQNGDNPPPQNGACPGNAISPITHTHSCWVFMDNYVHDNNDPNVPAAGSAAAGPVGTGMSLSGARNDTVMDNLFANNGAWGTVVVPYPDSGNPCTGGRKNYLGIGCEFDEYGDAVIDNRYQNDGFFGNPSNGPFDQVNLASGEPTDCFAGNTVVGGKLSGDAASLEHNDPSCNGHHVAANLSGVFLDQVACDSGAAPELSLPCVAGSYPTMTSINNGLHPLPPASKLPSMPDVCAGVPANPWCSGAVTKVRACAGPSVNVPLALARGERLLRVAVKVDRRSVAAPRGGANLDVELPAGGTARVKVTETVLVAGHRERFSFTRVYKRC
jgi:hypothetical protein